MKLSLAALLALGPLVFAAERVTISLDGESDITDSKVADGWRILQSWRRGSEGPLKPF
jgi:hypothetical protein